MIDISSDGHRKPLMKSHYDEAKGGYDMSQDFRILTCTFACM